MKFPEHPPPTPDQNDDEDRPLTASERRRVREIIRAQERTDWLWASVRVWATWITAVCAAAVVLWEVLKQVVQSAGGGK